MSLILIEDVDLIFEDFDEGFISGLVTLIQSTKRPVIMVANDPHLPHIIKFAEGKEIISFQRPDFNEICNWLQLVCLTENIPVTRESLYRLVHMHKGDIRRSLFQLQFWANSGGELQTSNTPTLTVHNFSFYSSLDIERTPLFGNPLHLPCIYWNLEKILNLIDLKDKNKIATVSKLFETIAWLERILPHRARTQSFQPWTLFSYSHPGVSLLENTDTWDQARDCLLPSIGSLMAERSVLLSRILLESPSASSPVSEEDFVKVKEHLEPMLFYGGAEQTVQRRRQKHLAAQRKCLSAVSLSSYLHRGALGLDYLPFLRQIARSEYLRQTNNIKRANRFFHYFKAIGIHLADSQIEILRNSFHIHEPATA